MSRSTVKGIGSSFQSGLARKAKRKGKMLHKYKALVVDARTTKGWKKRDVGENKSQLRAFVGYCGEER